MSLISCPECNAQISDKSTVCVHCGYPLSISSSDIDSEIELIENQLFDLQTALRQKKTHNVIYDKLNNLFQTVHKKIEYKSNPKYDDLLFIVTKHMCYNANIITHSIVTQYFSLVKMEYVTECGYTKSIELIQETIKTSYRHIIFWFPIYQMLENAPEDNKKYLKSLLEQPNAFGQPKINDIYSYAEKYLSGELKTSNKAQVEENAIECPYCKSTNVTKISTSGRIVSVGLFGLGSKKIGKQWHCNNCKSDF